MKKLTFVLFACLILIACKKEETAETIQGTTWETTINQEHKVSESLTVSYQRKISLHFQNETQGKIDFTPFNVPEGIVIEPVSSGFSYVYDSSSGAGVMTFNQGDVGEVNFEVSNNLLELKIPIDPLNPGVTTNLKLEKR